MYDEISKLADKVLGKLFKEKDATTSIAVMDKGEILYSNCFGIADKETGLKANQDTLFNIGSVSKTFAAVATMIFVDEGKLNLDEKVTTYLPEFIMADERHKNITVRMLIDHSSGLAGSTWNTGICYGINSDEKCFFLKTLKNASLRHDPGYANIYCNDGYSLLELVLEKVSGKSFIEILNEKIFVPLNIKNTSISVGECKENNNIAKFYDENTKKVMPNEVVNLLAAGGISSTPHDLCVFGKIFFENKKNLLSKSSRAEMLKIQPTPFSEHFDGIMNFGLGWDGVRTLDGKNGTITILNKGGDTFNYHALFIVVPELEIVIAITTNSDKINRSRLGFDILDLLLESKEYDVSPLYVNLSSEEQKIPDNLYTYEENYISEEGIHSFSFDKENNTLISNSLKDSEKKDVFKYSSGYFKNQKEQHGDAQDNVYYFKEIDGVKYFVMLMPKWNASLPAFQQAQKNSPINLSETIQNKIWLRRNSKPYDINFFLKRNHLVIPHVYNEVPGYVDFVNVCKITSPNSASFSVIIRDGSEFILSENNNQNSIICNGLIYDFDDVCAKLKEDKNIVSIGDKSYSEWLIIDKNCTLNFEIPEDARIVIFNAKGKILYDNITSKENFIVTEKCYIECMGNFGDKFVITVS